MCFIILLLALFHTHLHGEYIFFKKNPVTQAEVLSAFDHHVIYPKFIQHTFPMSTNPILNCSLSKNQNKRRQNNECQFLNEIIGPNYQVQFIPTTLYELFVAHAWTKFELIFAGNQNETPIYSSVCALPESRIFWQGKVPFFSLCSMEKPVKKTLRSMNNIWLKNLNYTDEQRIKKSYESYNQLNNLTEVQKTHLLVNNYIINYLNEHGIDIHTVSHYEIAQTILKDLSDYFSQFIHRLDLAFSSVNFETLLYWGLADRDLLTKIIAIEIDAHSQNHFVLYRGTHKIKDRGNKIDSTLTIRNNEILPTSLSYGNSLYAAMLGDDCLHVGAMAYQYLKSAPISYALLINKQDFEENAYLSNIFFIPPISTLVGILSQGELFHSRTKGVVRHNNPRLCGIWFFSGTGKYLIPQFLINDIQDASLCEKLFSDYLVNNIKIITNKTGISEKELFQHQLAPAHSISFNHNPNQDEPNELEFIVKRLKLNKN